MLYLADALDAWSSIYANSASIRSATAFAHIGGLIVAGGSAIAADRAILLAGRGGADAVRDEAARFGGVHRVVVAGLTLVTISGLVLLSASVDAYLHAPMFWMKMGLVAALLLNGLLVLRASGAVSEGQDRAFRRLQLASVVSVILWCLTTLAGAALPNAL